MRARVCATKSSAQVHRLLLLLNENSQSFECENELSELKFGFDSANRIVTVNFIYSRYGQNETKQIMHSLWTNKSRKQIFNRPTESTSYQNIMFYKE